MQIALIGFVAANAIAFLISHQVYGDALVMILTAFMIGVVLSSSRWSASRAEMRPAPAPVLARTASR